MKFGYARVSTTDQTSALQRDALRRAGCKRIYEETASGASGERTQLTALLAQLRAGDVVVVWKLDRLARSLAQLIATINDLKARGVAFIALTNQIDTTTAQGRFTFHLLGALAEFERAIISERTKAGMQAAKARGAKPGRPTLMTPATISAAKALAARNWKPAEIAARLRVSVSSLYRYLPSLTRRAARARQRRLGKASRSGEREVL
jgi:DNA invertase Pin-like site-specific DNA recombinase